MIAKRLDGKGRFSTGLALVMAAAAQSAGTLVAEGDSWFDYPFHDVLEMLDDDYSAKSVNNTLATLSKILHYAQDLEMIAKMPRFIHVQRYFFGAEIFGRGIKTARNCHIYLSSLPNFAAKSGEFFRKVIQFSNISGDCSQIVIHSAISARFVTVS